MRAKILLATAAAMSLIIATQIPAAAETRPVLSDAAQSEGVKTTRVTIPLEAPQSLTDVLQIREARGYPVQAYRFENDEIVGEYSPETGISPKEYLAGFEERYGTQPQVVSVIAEVSVDTAEKWYREGSSKGIAVLGEEFKAAPIDREHIDRLLEESRKNSQTSTNSNSAKAKDWKPLSADVQVFRDTPNTVFFLESYYWDAATNTNALDSGFGIELEVNVRTNSPTYSMGLRGACSAGYKEYPMAKNYGWTWEAVVNGGAGAGPVGAAVGAYADYNDLSDPCNKNSIAIGFKAPQQLPTSSNGIQEVFIAIQAPRGVENTSYIGGLVQSVNAASCYAAPWLALTDCMGTSGGSKGVRMTLNEAWNYKAPDKCWRSQNYGLIDPVPYTC